MTAQRSLPKSVRAKIPTWLLFVVFMLILLRVMMSAFNLYFASVYAEKLFWVLISLGGLAVWFLALRETGRSLLILFSLLGYTCWYIIAFKDIESSMPENFRSIDRDVWMQTQRTLSGSNGKYTVRVGKRYLGGIFFLEHSRFEHDFYSPLTAAGPYRIPKNLPHPERCVFWKARGWLFDFDNHVCYKLERKKS